MNHIYRLIWNRTLGAYVVASELARPQGGGAIAVGARSPLASLSALCVALALALAGGSAHASDDRRLDDLVALVGKYVDASGAPVQADVQASVLVSPGTAAPSAQRQDARTVAAVPASSPLPSPAQGTAAGHAIRAATDRVAATASQLAAPARQAAVRTRDHVAGAVAATPAAVAHVAERVAARLPDVSATAVLDVAVPAATPPAASLLSVALDLGAADRAPAPQPDRAPVRIEVGLDIGRQSAAASPAALSLDAAVAVGGGRGRGGLLDVDADLELLRDAGFELIGDLDAGLEIGRAGLALDADLDLDAAVAQAVAELDLDLETGAAPRLPALDAQLTAGATLNARGTASGLHDVLADTHDSVSALVERVGGHDTLHDALETVGGALATPEQALADALGRLPGGDALGKALGQAGQELQTRVGGLAGQVRDGLADGDPAAVVGGGVATVGALAGETVSSLGTALTGLPGGDALAGRLDDAGGRLDAVVGGMAGRLQEGLGDADPAGVLHGTLGQVHGTVGETVAGLGAALGGLSGGGTPAGGNPLRGALTGTVGTLVGTLDDAVGGLLGQTGLDGAVRDLGEAAGDGVPQLGDGLGGLVGGLTGSDALADTVTTATDGLATDVEALLGHVAATDLQGVLGTTSGVLGGTVGSLVGDTTGTLSGLLGSSSGLDGLGQVVGGTLGGLGGALDGVVGGLTGTTPMAAPPVPAQAGSPGLIIGTGGLTGSLGELLDGSTSGLFGGDGYIRNGNFAVNSANVQQGYSVVSVLGVPTVNLTPVGTLLDGVGNAATGGSSYLTLIGGVTSDSYITGINNGAPGGLLGLVLPDGAPAWASECANVLGLVNVDCWAVNAAQNYQVLIGDGAYANGSKEVVIGTNARHQLAQQSAAEAFPGAGLDDPDNPTGVPTADYAARLGHSVVIGDNAFGSANAQVLLGAGATSDRANSVALGFQSNAARGAQASYAAFGLAAPQRSVGEVAVGSAGNERQITHVAAGSAATDAVNVAQLQGAISLAGGVDAFAVKYDADAGGQPDYGSITLGDGGGSTRVTNLADAAIAAGSLDAVNGGQIHAGYQTLSSYFGGTTGFTGGTWTGPVFRISNIALNGAEAMSDYDSVTAAFDALNSSLVNVNLRIQNSGVGGVDEPYLSVNSTAAAAVASGAEAVAVGPRSLATGDASVAVGDAAQASADNSVALGAGSVASTGAEQGYTGAYAAAGSSSSAGEVSVGSSGAERKVTNVADGSDTHDAVNVGQLDAGVSYAIDQSREYTDIRINNLGGGTAGMFQVNDSGNLGTPRATGQASAAGGAGAVASGNGSTAVGNGAQAQAANSVALGAGSVADRANTVSVGSAGSQRQVTHVAAGTADTDAVNVAQMNRGMSDTLGWARAYTDDRFASVGREMERIDDRASAGVASAMAMAGLPQPYEAGRNMASIAAGSFNGESGMAIGISGVTEGGRWIYKLSGTTNTRGDGGVSIGAGIQW